MTFYSVAFHSLMYFLVWSKNHCYGKNAFPLPLLPNHTIFPVAILVGQGPFAVACAVFCCCGCFSCSAGGQRGFNVGQSFPIPRGAGGEPVLRVPVGRGALDVFTRTQHSVRSYLLSSSWRISPEQIDLTVLHFPGPFASCPVGYLPLEGTFWPLHICKRH